MTLQELYDYQVENRKHTEPLFGNLPLCWCGSFHIHDKNGKYLFTIEGKYLTDFQLEQYKDYYEFKPMFCGYDYTHHHYLKPRGDTDE